MIAAGQVQIKPLEQALIQITQNLGAFGHLVLKIGDGHGAVHGYRKLGDFKRLVLNQPTRDWIEQAARAPLQKLTVFQAAMDLKAYLVCGPPADPGLELFVGHVGPRIHVDKAKTDAEGGVQARPKLVIQPVQG